MIQTGQNRSASWKFWCGVVILIFPNIFFEETYDENGNPIWECTCIIPDYDLKTKGTSSKKKEAKKDAAFEALERVLGES